MRYFVCLFVLISILIASSIQAVSANETKLKLKEEMREVMTKMSDDEKQALREKLKAYIESKSIGAIETSSGEKKG